MSNQHINYWRKGIQLLRYWQFHWLVSVNNIGIVKTGFAFNENHCAPAAVKFCRDWRVANLLISYGEWFNWCWCSETQSKCWWLVEESRCSFLVTANWLSSVALSCSCLSRARICPVVYWEADAGGDIQKMSEWGQSAKNLFLATPSHKSQ